MISIVFWILIREIFSKRGKFITRRKGFHLASWEQFSYMARRDLWEIRNFFVIAGVVLPVFFYSLYLEINKLLSTHWDEFLLLVASAIAITVAIIIYDRTKTSSEKYEIRIRRIESIIHSKFDFAIKGKENSIFQLIFALEGILFNLEDLEEEVNRWIKESNQQKKDIIKQRCIFNWNSIMDYSKILDDEEIISSQMFTNEIIKKVKEISKQCKISLEFNESENQCRHEGIRSIILYSLLILDKFDIFTQYRRML